VRHLRHAIARGLLATFLVGLTAPALSARHGATGDDASCGPGLVNGHPVEQFEPVLPPVVDDHCALCHWLRAVGGASPAGAQVQDVGLDPLGACGAGHLRATRRLANVGCPPRAPPPPAD
jgi:hypothetical protein